MQTETPGEVQREPTEDLCPNKADTLVRRWARIETKPATSVSRIQARVVAAPKSTD